MCEISKSVLSSTLYKMISNLKEGRLQLRDSVKKKGIGTYGNRGPGESFLDLQIRIRIDHLSVGAR